MRWGRQQETGQYSSNGGGLQDELQQDTAACVFLLKVSETAFMTAGHHTAWLVAEDHQ